MRFDPGFDAQYAGSDPAVAEGSRTTPTEPPPDRGPSLRQQLVGFLLRPN